MSNSPELSPQRPSLVKTTLRKVKELVTSPYGVAAIASLSFHGVLFAAMPRFSSASFAAFSEEEVADAAPRTVPLVTLSPAEQGRLPDFNRSRLPAIPDINSRPSINNLPNASSLNRSNIFTRPNIFNRSSSNRTTNPSLSSPNTLRRNRPFQNPYIPRPNISIRDTPTQSGQSRDRKTTTITIPAPPPSVVPEIDTDQDTLARELELEQQQAEQAAAEQTEANEGLPDLPEQSDQEATSEDTENTEVAANPEPTDQPTQLERLQAKFNYDAESTTPEEVEDNYKAWEANTDSAIDGAVETAEIGALNLDASFNLCAQNPPTNGEVGILVAPDGTPSNPTVLRSTGYDYLNQVAIDTLMDSEFPATEQATRYPFELIVNYDAEACRSTEELLEIVRNDEQGSTEPESSSTEPESNEQGPGAVE
ncbi:Gram-negative bacterial tonB protein [Leptolyngbya sp. PCC 7375]|nr:Gram-negative bacterial tonB protein [Leptolyngbya sp. PCC 7375]